MGVLGRCSAACGVLVGCWPCGCCCFGRRVVVDSAPDATFFFVFILFACLDLKVFSSFSAGLRKTRVIQMEALDWRLPVQCVFS